MSLKNWLVCIGVSVATLTVVVVVMLGIQAVIIETGRAIVH